MSESRSVAGLRVLFLCDLSPESATNRYRCAHLAEALAARGARADVVSIREARSVRVDHDVVVLHRLPWGAHVARLAAAARAVGAALVYGVDDLIFAPDYAYQVGMAHPDDPARYRYHRGEVEAVAETLAACDAVLVSTEFLAAEARSAAAAGGADRPVFVLRNRLGGEMLRLADDAHARARRAPRCHDRVTLGYLSGSPTHDADLADVAAPLAAVLEAHPRARLFVVGPASLPGPLERFAREGRVRRHPFVPWRDLPGLAAEVDVNLAPLDPTRRFAHAKSEIKWLEAAALGVPTVAGWAAGVAEGIAAVGASEGGDPPCCVLVREHDRWHDALADLVRDPARRQMLGEAARDAALERGTVAADADRVADVFARIAALASTDRRGGAAVTVAPSLRARLERAVREQEAAWVRRSLRWRRHRALLEAEQRDRA